MDKSEIAEVIQAWNSWSTQDLFMGYLKIARWTRIYDGMWKVVYYKNDVVVKFDREGDRSWACATANEYYQWVRAVPRKRKYMLKPVAYCKGLLIQPKLPHICSPVSCDCDDALPIARRLRILDWYNHGRTLDGKLKFFDTDSQGSNWWNWKRK